MAAYSLLSRDPSILFDCLSETEFDSKFIEFLATLYGTDSLNPEQPGKPKLAYGLLDANLSDETMIIDVQKIPQQHFDDMAKFRGLMYSICLVLKFVRDKNRDTLLNLLNNIGNQPGRVQFLPHRVRALLSSDFMEKSISGDINGCLQINKSVFYKRFAIRRDRKSIDWKNFINNMPQLAVHIVCSPVFDDISGLSDGRIDDNIGELLYNKLKYCSYILVQSISSWPRLLDKDHNPRYAALFRNLILESASSTVGSDDLNYETVLFTVALPEESALLPHILAGLVNKIISRSSYNSLDNDYSIHELIKTFAGAIDEIFGGFQALSDVVSDINCEKRVRAAALVMSYFHSDATQEYKNWCIPIFCTFFEQEEAKWYLPSVALALMHGIEVLDLPSLEAMGNMINLARSNYPARLALDPIVQTWREFSRGPVKLRSSPQMWQKSKRV